MKPLGLILILILVSATYGVSATQNEDDFSEFDDFDEDPVAHKVADEDDFDDEEEEFVHEPPVNQFLNFSREIEDVHTHCSKSSFFVQKFNFDFPRKSSIFLGVKNS